MAETSSSDPNLNDSGGRNPTIPIPKSLLTGGSSLDASNTMLGEFQLVRKLGQGGMAEVYLAEQTTLRRQVAVKVLRPEFITDEQYVKRFRHEAAAAGSLNHPNIVQVYMVGEHGGVNYIAQEFVQGRTLKDYLNRKGPMEFKIALHILRQVASALQVASENGIVHRDIKPENILLTSKGEAKVADFGLAQLTLQGERVSLTQSGITMGTPLYMSPEQINGQPLDARSDMYSFGVMAWHMLAGRPPFNAETAMAVAVKHLNEAPPLLSDFRPDVSPALRDFIKRLMSKKKEDRPADFASIVVELKQLIRQFSGKEGPSVVLKPSAGRLSILDRPLIKQLGWMVPICILILGSSAGIGWAMRTPDLLLLKSNGQLKVTKMTVDGQLFWAFSHPQDETAWIALKTHPDATLDMKSRAEVALSLIYLNTNRRVLAEKSFNEMMLDSRLKSNGLAGQALIAGIRHENDTVHKLLAQIDSMNSKLTSEMDAALKDLRTRFQTTP